MTTYQQGLIDGAKMGAGQVGTALFMMETNFVGTSTQIAEAMREHKSAAVGRVFILHRRGFLHIVGWTDTKNSQPVYTWGPGKPDVAKPKKTSARVERVVANAMKRKNGPVVIDDNVARRATKHGHEEINGAVRVHRMRG